MKKQMNGTNNLFLDVKLEQQKVLDDLKKLEQVLEKEEKKLNEKTKITPTIDNSKITEGFDEIKLVARDTGKALDGSLLKSLEANSGRLEILKEQARDLKKELQKGFKEGIIPQAEYQKAVESLKKISGETTEANRQLNNYKNTGDVALSRLQAKFNGVTDEIRKNRAELVKLGKNTGGLDVLEKNLNKLDNQYKSGAISLDNYQKELGELQKELDGGDGVNKAFDGLLGAINPTTIALTGLATAGGLLINRSLEIEKSLKQLQGQLGLTKEEVEGLEQTFLNISSTGFLIDENNVKIISALRKELNLTNDEIEDTAIGIGAITDVFGKDYNEVLRANTGLQKNFGISGQEANDLITKSLQLTGDTYDDFLDSVNEYSPKAKDSGIEAERFLNILIEGTKKGIRNTDELAEVQREMAIKLQDGSKTTIGAFDRLGISYDDFTGKISSGKMTVGEGMQYIAKEIQKIEDPIEKTQIATALMGTKFEDNGSIILDVMADTQTSIGKTQGKTEELVQSQITGTKAIKMAWDTFSNDVGALMGGSVTDIGTKFAFLFNFLLQGSVGIGQAFILGLKTISVGFVALGEGIGKVIGFIFENVKLIPENFGIAFDNIPGAIEKGLKAALKLVGAFIDSITFGLGGKFSDALGLGKMVDDINYFGSKDVKFKSVGLSTKDFEMTSKLFGALEKDALKVGDTFKKAVTGVKFDFGYTKKETSKGGIENLLLNGDNKTTGGTKNTGGSGKTKQIKDDTELKAQLEQQNNYSKYLEKLEKEKADKKEARFKKDFERLKEYGELTNKNEDDLLLANKQKTAVIEKLFLLQNMIGDDEEKGIEINKEVLKLKGEIADNNEKILDSQKKATQDYYNGIVKSAEETQKNIDSLTEKLGELEERIKQTKGEQDTSIAERNLAIQKEIIDLEKELVKIKSGGTADALKEKELETLKRELEFNNQNVDSLALAEAQRQEGLSQTEKILEGYAEKLEALELEKATEQAKYDQEVLNLQTLQELKTQAELDFSALITQETDKRLTEIERYRQSAIKLGNTLRSLGFVGNISTARLGTLGTESTQTATAPTVVNITNNNNVASTVDVRAVARQTAKDVARATATGNTY